MLPKNPGDRIGNVGLATAIRSYNGGDPLALKLHLSAIAKGFEAKDLDLFQLEQGRSLSVSVGPGAGPGVSFIVGMGTPGGNTGHRVLVDKPDVTQWNPFR